MRNRDSDQTRRGAQCLHVERLPGTLLDAVVKSDSTPPSATGHDRNAHDRFHAFHREPVTLVLWKLTHPAIRHLAACTPRADLLERIILDRMPHERLVTHAATNSRRVPFEEIVLQILAVGRDRVLHQQDTAYSHDRPEPAQQIFHWRTPAAVYQDLRGGGVDERKDCFATFEVGHVDTDGNGAAFLGFAVDHAHPASMVKREVEWRSRLLPLNKPLSHIIFGVFGAHLGGAAPHPR